MQQFLPHPFAILRLLQFIHKKPFMNVEDVRQRSLVEVTRNFGDILGTFAALQITHRKKPIVRYASRV